MLGENHCLLNDFPHLSDTIQHLNQSDPAFAKKATEYHQLDEEIRKLELKDSPIIDEAMQLLKHNRSVLKDWLYRQLTSA